MSFGKARKAAAGCGSAVANCSRLISPLLKQPDVLYRQALAGTVGMSAVAPRQHQDCSLACASGLAEEVGVYLRSCLNPMAAKSLRRC